MPQEEYTKGEVQNAVNIIVTGLVQGVGFRPFIYRLAKQFDLKGWVKNRNDGVQIKIEGDTEKIKLFILHLKKDAPFAASIETISHSETKLENLENFIISKSKNTSDEITQISPDIAVCPECLQDLKAQPNRINYPFINCTNCAPRFSIIKDLPYENAMTTMA